MSKHKLTIIVALLSTIGPFTIDTYLPSFPSIEATYHVSRAMLSQSLAVYLLAFAISTLFWGPLSDRIGRKKVVLVAMVLYTLASIGCALAESYSMFLLSRMAQGLAASGTMVIGRLMIRDTFDPQGAQRAMAQVMMLFAIAPAIAPIIGGLLHDFMGWQSVFYFLAAYGLVSTLLVKFLVQETLPVENRQSFHPRHVLRMYMQTLQHPRFLLLTSCIATSFAGFFLYIVGSPIVVFDFLGLGSTSFHWMFVPMVAGMIAGSSLSARLAYRWSQHAIVKLTLSILAVASLLNIAQALYLEVMLLTVMIPLVLYAFGVALGMSVLTVMALDCFPKNRGAASSTQGFSQMMLYACVASLIVPALAAQPLHFALGQAGFMLIAVLCWIGLSFVGADKVSDAAP